MSTPTPSVRKVIAEYNDGEWLTLTPEGDVQLHSSPEAILAWIKYRDERHGTGFDVTVLEWQNVPAGFVPPTPA